MSSRRTKVLIWRLAILALAFALSDNSFVAASPTQSEIFVKSPEDVLMAPISCSPSVGQPCSTDGCANGIMIRKPSGACGCSCQDCTRPIAPSNLCEPGPYEPDADGCCRPCPDGSEHTKKVPQDCSTELPDNFVVENGCCEELCPGQGGLATQCATIESAEWDFVNCRCLCFVDPNEPCAIDPTRPGDCSLAPPIPCSETNIPDSALCIGSGSNCCGALVCNPRTGEWICGCAGCTGERERGIWPPQGDFKHQCLAPATEQCQTNAQKDGVTNWWDAHYSYDLCDCVRPEVCNEGAPCQVCSGSGLDQTCVSGVYARVGDQCVCNTGGGGGGGGWDAPNSTPCADGYPRDYSRPCGPDLENKSGCCVCDKLGTACEGSGGTWDSVGCKCSCNFPRTRLTGDRCHCEKETDVFYDGVDPVCKDPPKCNPACEYEENGACKPLARRPEECETPCAFTECSHPCSMFDPKSCSCKPNMDIPYCE